MQCLILAGGLAARLRPVTATVPKAMVPVAGRPFADLQLRWLAAQGFTDVVYSIGYLGEQIRAYVGSGDRFGIRVAYVDEGDALRGTAGALRLANDEGVLSDRFAVLYGDSYLTVPVAEVWEHLDRTGADAVMTVWRNDGRLDTSNVEYRDGWVVRYDKTVADPVAEGLHWIDYGFSLIDRDAVMPRIPPDAVVDLASVQRDLSIDGGLAGFEVSERFFEIGSPAGLSELEAHIEAGHAPDDQ